MRKQMLFAEIIILGNSLSEAALGATAIPIPSQEEVDKMTIPELEALKRELRDLSRSLGGARGR
jgi:hypothetical protein